MKLPELEELYRRYRMDLYRYLCFLPHDPVQAEDLLSETYVRVSILNRSGFSGNFCQDFLEILFIQFIIKSTPIRTDCIGNRTARIETVCCFCKTGSKCVTIVHTAAFWNFISSGSDDNGRMITVTFHKASQVFLPVRVEKLIVISRLFHDSPGIKCFIIHIHSKAVADFHKRS